MDKIENLENWHIAKKLMAVFFKFCQKNRQNFYLLKMFIFGEKYDTIIVSYENLCPLGQVKLITFGENSTIK